MAVSYDGIGFGPRPAKFLAARYHVCSFLWSWTRRILDRVSRTAWRVIWNRAFQQALWYNTVLSGYRILGRDRHVWEDIRFHGLLPSSAIDSHRHGIDLPGYKQSYSSTQSKLAVQTQEA